MPLHPVFRLTERSDEEGRASLSARPNVDTQSDSCLSLSVATEYECRYCRAAILSTLQALGSSFPLRTRAAQRWPFAPTKRKEWIGRRTCNMCIYHLANVLDRITAFDGVNGGKRHIILK